VISEFLKEEHEGSTLQLVKSRVGEEVLELSPSLWSCVVGASKEGAIPVLHIGYRHLEEMSRGSSTHELMRLRIVKGDFGYKGLTVGSLWTEIPKSQSPEKYRAEQSSEKS
jgi:hypothetical protein